MTRGEYPIVRISADIDSHPHIVHQQTDVAQCVILAFAGGTDNGNILEAFFNEKIDGFSLIICFLTGIVMDDFFVLLLDVISQRVPISHYSIRYISFSYIFIRATITTYNVCRFIQHL